MRKTSISFLRLTETAPLVTQTSATKPTATHNAAAEPAITPELVASHGIKPDEYQRLLALIGREPSFTELGIVSAMWNEHCSYKSSRRHLRKLATTAPWVIHGPGENAGVIDIFDDLVCVFKMESHNHPSFIEPKQGAATGVGGILRDVFTMGARPIACLNALHFGAPDHPRTRQLVAGVVEGIGSYGNAFGVPTVGGMVGFDERYNGNILVNAMAVGLAPRRGIFLSSAKGVGNPIVYLGSKTGRDGIHGASMASASFEKDAEEKRPTVQVGDPFAEKLLLEACLELMATGAVIAIQDMGAAGLTCSAVEMGAKGNLGIELNLDHVPCRETGMSAYEMMLSESQERMLMVLKPELEDEAKAVFRKWGLDFATIGQTTDTLRFVVKHQGEIKADLPIKELGDAAPLYDRPYDEIMPPPRFDSASVEAPLPHDEALLTLMGGADLCSKRWVYEQYDSLILGNTLSGPGIYQLGGDAAVVRILDTDRGLALSCDVTPRYCEADPYEGGKQAVAECWRNISAVGAEPLALTDNLNFGNPEKPHAMGQLVGCIEGIAAAARALDFPVVSGNVSLYNETIGVGILPTPTIGGVGLLDELEFAQTMAFKAEGEVIILVGVEGSELGCSLYQRAFLGGLSGAPPKVDLEREMQYGKFIRALIAGKRVTAVHDCSDGGLFVAIAEMALAGNIGAKLKLKNEHLTPAFLFGEDQARYVITATPANADYIMTLIKAAEVDCMVLGKTHHHGEEASLQIPGCAPILLERLRETHEAFFPTLMQN